MRLFRGARARPLSEPFLLALVGVGSWGFISSSRIWCLRSRLWSDGGVGVGVRGVGVIVGGFLGVLDVWGFRIWPRNSGRIAPGSLSGCVSQGEGSGRVGFGFRGRIWGPRRS